MSGAGPAAGPRPPPPPFREKKLRQRPALPLIAHSGADGLLQQAEPLCTRRSMTAARVMKSAGVLAGSVGLTPSPVLVLGSTTAECCLRFHYSITGGAHTSRHPASSAAVCRVVSTKAWQRLLGKLNFVSRVIYGARHEC